MKEDEAERKDYPDEAPQINYINKVEEPPRDKEPEPSCLIDEESRSRLVNTCHIGTEEQKINKNKL